MQPAAALPTVPATPSSAPSTASTSSRSRSSSTLPSETGARWAGRYRRRLRVTDHAVVVASVVAGAALAPWLPEPVAPSVPPVAAATALVAVVWALCLAVYGSRDLVVVGSGVGEYKRVAGAGVLATALVAVLGAVAGVPVGPHHLVVALPLGTVALLASRRAHRRWLTRRRAEGRHLVRALVVGATVDVAYVADRLRAARDSVYDVVGVVVTDAPGGSGPDAPWGGTDISDISRAAWRLGADSVVVTAEAGRDHEWLRELAWQLEGRAAELVLAAPLAEVAGPRVHFRPVDGLPLVHVELPRFTGGALVAKRVFDVVASALALVVAAPLLLVLALAVKLDDGGPVLFRQERVGRDGRTFEMLKFRTMVVDAEARLASLRHLDEGAGVLFKLRHDPRVTRTGRVLRRWSLDELPQLWNVLRGEMSVVGPRPPLPREVDGYARHVHRRLSCTPGLTGLWQVSGRSDLGWDEGVRLDLWYVENRSLVGDLVIVWRTVRVLLRPTGAY